MKKFLIMKYLRINPPQILPKQRKIKPDSSWMAKGPFWMDNSGALWVLRKFGSQK